MEDCLGEEERKTKGVMVGWNWRDFWKKGGKLKEQKAGWGAMYGGSKDGFEG